MKRHSPDKTDKSTPTPSADRLPETHIRSNAEMVAVALRENRWSDEQWGDAIASWDDEVFEIGQTLTHLELTAKQGAKALDSADREDFSSLMDTFEEEVGELRDAEQRLSTVKMVMTFSANRPSNLSDSRLDEAKKVLAKSSALGTGKTAETATALLTPKTVFGDAVGPIAAPGQVLAVPSGARAPNERLLKLAHEGFQVAFDKREAKGADAMRAALDLVNGPLSSFPVDSGEGMYIRKVAALAVDLSPALRKAIGTVLGSDIGGGDVSSVNWDAYDLEVGDTAYAGGHLEGGLQESTSTSTSTSSDLSTPHDRIDLSGADAKVGTPTPTLSVSGAKDGLNDAGDHTSHGASVDARLGETSSVGVAVTRARKSTQGGETVTDSSLSGGVEFETGPDGDSYTASLSGKQRHDDGSSTSVTKKITLGDGKVGGGTAFVNRDKDGNVKNGAGVAGSVTRKEGEFTLEGQGHVQIGKTKVTVKGGRTEKIYPVEQLPGRRFRVRYGVIYTGGGSVGKSSKDGARGASIGGTATREQLGSRIFSSMDEANAFRKKGELPSDRGLPASWQDALAMKPGELRGDKKDNTLEGSAHRNLGSVNVGARASASETGSLDVERASGKTVSATFSKGDAVSIAGFIGAGGISIGKGLGSGAIESVKVDFDLSHAAGQHAYEYFVRTRKLPPTGAGYELRVKMAAKTKSDTTSISAPGLSWDRTRSLTEGTRTADGVSSEFSVGDNSQSLKIWQLGHYGEQHQLQAVQSGKDRYYTVRSSVDASDKRDDAQAFYRMTGHYQSAESEVGGDSRGKWSVTSVFESKDMENFASYAKDPSLATSTYGAPFSPDRRIDADDALSKIRHGAGEHGNKNSLRRGLAEYVKEGGRHALSDLRSYGGYQDPTRSSLPGKEQQFHIELENDPYWTGFKGHQLTQLELRTYRRRIEAGKEGRMSLYLEIRESIRFQEERRNKLPTYQEVPYGLVAQELKRTDTVIRELETLRGLALEMDEPKDDAEGISTGGNPAWLRFDKAERGTRKARRTAEPARNEAWRQRVVHLKGGNADMGFAEHVPSEVLAKKEKTRYAAADAAWKRADAVWNRAEDALNRLDARVKEDAPLFLEATATRARIEYERAAAAFEKASKLYVAIASDNGHVGHLARAGSDSPEARASMFNPPVRKGAFRLSLPTIAGR